VSSWSIWPRRLRSGTSCSARSADKDTGIPHFDSKYLVERYLAAGSVPFTVVRPVFLMENWELYREATQGTDGELGEDLAKAVFGGAGADEQPGGDLGVGQAFGSQPGDLGFLGGEPTRTDSPVISLVWSTSA
jgi:hypothetical protein